MAISGSQTPASVRIVVAGEPKTGKSSLILTAATGNFPPNVPPVLPSTKLTNPHCVPVTAVDTNSSSDPKSRNKVVDELKKADAVVLTYACDSLQTLDRLSSFWLPELRRLEVKVPVVVVGCCLDKVHEECHLDLEQAVNLMMKQFREIKNGIFCSAKLFQVDEVLFYALRAVLYPIAPLFDYEEMTMKPRCVRALKRIFTLCDHDRDGSLSAAELNDFQMLCFNAPLQASEIAGIRSLVQDMMPDGVTEDGGLTLNGFLCLHSYFIDQGRQDTTWTALRKFGYNNDLRLADYMLMLPSLTKRHPDQIAELTDEALDFLRTAFDHFDLDEDSSLTQPQLEDLFTTAPENPWNVAPYKDSAEKNGLILDGFLSQWTLMALLDPVRCFEHLIYLGYTGDVSSSIRVTRKKQLSDRNVFQCFVFGPEGAGKSAVLDSLTGRPFNEEHFPTTDDRYAVHAVQQPGSTRKTLVLREIPEYNVDEFLADRHALAACDVALFVHDRSQEASSKRAAELLIEVADSSQGYHEFPCLIAAAKDDLDAHDTEIQDSVKVSQDLGMEAPIPISTRLGEMNDIYQRIVSAAENPRMSVPETEARRRRKHYRRLVNHSLVYGSVGAAVAIIGFGAYRIYAAGKTSSA